MLSNTVLVNDIELDKFIVHCWQTRIMSSAPSGVGKLSTRVLFITQYAEASHKCTCGCLLTNRSDKSEKTVTHTL